MSFVPEVFCDKASEADRALKVLALYFDQVRIHTGPLILPQMRVPPSRDRVNGITHWEHKEGMAEVGDLFRRYKPLVDAGVLTELGLPKDETFSAVLQANRRVNVQDLPKFWKRAGVVEGTPWADYITWRILDVLIPTITLMITSKGVVSSTNQELTGLYHEYMNRTRAPGAFPPLPEQALLRTRRDALAASVLHLALPNVADLTFEQVLELRDKQRDGLRQFRTEMANLSKEAPTEGPEWEHYVRRMVEERVEPAVAELRRQQEELRRSSLLSFVGNMPTTLQNATATASLLGRTRCAGARAQRRSGSQRLHGLRRPTR